MHKQSITLSWLQQDIFGTIVSPSFDFESDENLTDTHTRKIGDAVPFEAVIGRHQRFAVDVWETLRELDNRKEMASQTTVYRESNSVASAPSGKW